MTEIWKEEKGRKEECMDREEKKEGWNERKKGRNTLRREEKKEGRLYLLYISFFPCKDHVI